MVPLGEAEPVITHALNAWSSVALATRGVNKQSASVEVTAGVETAVVAVETMPVVMAWYGVPDVRAPLNEFGCKHQQVPLLTDGA